MALGFHLSINLPSPGKWDNRIYSTGPPPLLFFPAKKQAFGPEIRVLPGKSIGGNGIRKS
jgi:hypothetical protein